MKQQEKNNKNFLIEFQDIKLNVLKFLYRIFILLGFFTIAVFVYNFLFIQDYGFESSDIFYFLFTVTVTAIFILFYFRLNRKNYVVFITIFIALFLIISVLIALSFGTFFTITYPLIIISILIISIIFDIRKAQIFALTISVIFIGISILHNIGIIGFTPVMSNSKIGNTIITLALIWIVVTITKVGFSEIESSYNKALEYSKKMEKVNKELDELVKQRTKIIQDNYETQIESIYSTSVIGSITRPLMHDIANPISALLGTIDLMDQSRGKDQKLIELAKQSTEQLYHILMESRELMRGNTINETFNIQDDIARCVQMIQSELNRYNIKIKIEAENDYNLNGIRSMFDRLLINIIVNAMEELKTIEDRERNINIKVEKAGEFIEIRIKDNGNGIKKANIDNIFKPDFSLKNTAHNLGLGLPFVKKIIETKFDGNVRVESIEGFYAEVILNFKYSE